MNKMINVSQSTEELKQTGIGLKRLVRLYIENAKLASIEKATVLLGHAALIAVLAALAVIAFFFLSMGAVLVLSQALPEMWCFLIMGGLYLVLGALAFVFRTTLFINPLARYMSRLFFDAPDKSARPVKTPDNE